MFEVGDKVWLSGKNINTTRPTKKLDVLWHGPFAVEKVVSRSAYKLKLTKSYAKLYPVFHVSLLRRHHPDEIAERPQLERPEPELVGDHEEYQVSEVLNSRLRNRRLEYLVSFKGYGPEENEWLPEENLENAKEAIAEFRHKNPGAPRRISATVMNELMFRAYENLTQPPPSAPITSVTRRGVES